MATEIITTVPSATMNFKHFDNGFLDISIESGDMTLKKRSQLKGKERLETNVTDKNFNIIPKSELLSAEITDPNTTDPKSSHMLHASEDSDMKFTKSEPLKWYQFKAPLIWLNIISIFLYHFAALFAYYIFFRSWTIKGAYTVLFAFFMGGVAGFGVTAGVHRLWSHRSYKAKLPLRIILMICYAVAGQNRIYDWVRDHRVHHKYSETDADPHNANRGFFFAHVGWLMMRKHPEVISKGQKIDMSDILADPVVKFSEKYFLPLKILFCFLLPSAVPVYFWDESIFIAFMSQGVVRYIMSLNFTWLVNSAAHFWGHKPYDRRIKPSQNLGVSIVAMGEGWHNYHHVFPWDYKAAELGNYRVNVTTFWLDLFAKIGWAYDMKSPSKELVEKIVKNTGDGTHPKWNHHQEIPEEADIYR